ncbi:MAG: NUDIX hydrolase, partial [Bacteroidota bacterium]
MHDKILTNSIFSEILIVKSIYNTLTMWEKLKITKLIDTPWLKVKDVSFKKPNGHIIEPYFILEFPDWVNIVAITKKKEVVLTKQYRPGINKTILELPSGWINKNEEPAKTAKRELLEETGYFAENIIFTGKVSPNPS